MVVPTYNLFRSRYRFDDKISDKKKREGTHLAMCMMKSNIVIVRTYLEMSLHSPDMDRDADLATLRNQQNRHYTLYDIFQRSDAQSV